MKKFDRDVHPAPVIPASRLAALQAERDGWRNEALTRKHEQGEAEAREKVLRDALERIAETDSDGLVHTAGGMAAIARAALSAHKDGA